MKTSVVKAVAKAIYKARMEDMAIKPCWLAQGKYVKDRYLFQAEAAIAEYERMNK